MGKLYERVNWENAPSTKTPKSAENFNIMDKGIDDLDNKLVEQETEMESLASQVEQIANNQIPEEYLKASVDAYIDEKGAGLATDEDLTVLDTKIEEVNNQLTSEIAEKISKSSIVNLNKDTAYSDVGALSQGTTVWCTDKVESFEVTDGIAKVILSEVNGRVIQFFDLIEGHQYYYHIPITSEAQSVLTHFGGAGGCRKHKKLFCENIFTWSATSGIYAFTCTNDDEEYYNLPTYLGKLCVIDLTECNIDVSEVNIEELREFVLREEEPKNVNAFYSIKKQRENIVNVKDFGAFGNGVTDDTTAIANAISSCPSGGTVYFPNGIYRVSDILVKSNITLKGDGESSIIKLNDNMTTPNQNCISINNVSNVIVKDLQLDGNRTANASVATNADGGWNGIHILGSTNVLVDNVVSHSNGYHGVIMVNVADIEIRNSKFYNNGYRPIHGHSIVNRVKIHNCECYDNGHGFEGESGGGSSLGNGFDAIFFFDDVHHLVISNNYIHDINSLACIQIGGALHSDGSATDNVQIVNNVFNGIGGRNGSVHGIQLMGGGLSNVNIMGNNITARDGILCNSDVEGENFGITIVGNNIFNCSAFGIRFATKYTDCIINSNIIDMGEQFGIYAIGCENLVISNNSVTDYQFCVVVASCADIIIQSNNVGQRKSENVLNSIKADNTNTRVYVLYNYANKGIHNESADGKTVEL